MTATQTLTSASLAVLLAAASTESARAEPVPDAPPVQPSGEARPEDDPPASPAEGARADDADGADRAPGDAATATPGDATTATPGDATTATPGDAATGTPGDAAPGDVPAAGGAPPTVPAPPASNAAAGKRPPTGTFEIGAGYSTDDHFIASARIAQPHLFGSDKGLALSSMISARQQEFLLRYDDPTLFDTQLRLRGELYDHRQIHPGWTREAAGGALTLSRTIAPHLDMFAGYKLEKITVDPNDVTTVPRTAGQPAEPFWRGGTIGAVRAGLVYDDTNAAYYPTRGTIIGSSIEIADRDLGSDLTYTRTDAWFAHHRGLGPFTLHLGGSVRTISDSVPMSERLHFDGSRDVRGYAPDSIVPGGGNVMWTARGELELPLSSSFSVAGFVDAGGLASRTDGRNAMSAGLGVIWRSPIGPLRFDVAFPLDGDGKPRYVFGIGGLF